MAKVDVVRYGIVHVSAQCDSCDWLPDNDLGLRKVKAAAKAHTLKTGHSTTVETGDSTEYRLSD